MKKVPESKFSKAVCAVCAVLFVVTCLLAGCDKGLSERPELSTSTEPDDYDVPVYTTKEKIPDYTLTSCQGANMDYSLTLYKVFDEDLEKSINADVDAADLRSFAREKLDYIFEMNDMSVRGSFQGYEVEIVRIDELFEWRDIKGIDSVVYNSNNTVCLGYYKGVADGGALQELICFDIYKDPSGRFILVTQCQDQKVIYEFFETGSTVQGGMVGTLPDGYDEFCKNAFKSSVCSEEQAVTWSKSNNVVVFEDSSCASGEGLWGAFCKMVTAGAKTSILCAHYYSEDKEHQGEYQYRAQVIFYYIYFDGEDFTVTARNCRSYNAEEPESYKYLLRFKGTNPDTEERAYYNFYVLTDNKSLTWEDIVKSQENPGSADQPDYKIVYKDMYGERTENC